MITPGCCRATGGATPRTPCGWPPRCARRWPPAASRTPCMSITARPLSTVVVAGVRETRCAPGAFHTRSARRQRQNREILQDRARAVPGRDHRRARRRRPPPRHRPGRAEPALRGLGRNRTTTARCIPRPGRPRWPAGQPAGPVRAARRRRRSTEAFLWEEHRRGDQDRDRVAARQQLRGRPGAGRSESGAGVRPVRPDPHRGPSGRRADGAGDPAPHRPALASESQTRNPRPRRRNPPASTTRG